MLPDDRVHVHHLRRAALLALRGHGGAEPNPIVGCVIIAPSGETVGWGYHRSVGDAHAEIVALERAGTRARGATLYCTLEPCNHHGRTGPCSQAIIEAGVKRVIIARRDPWSPASGGLERLAAAGVETRVIESYEFATRVSEPFAYRKATALPWVTVKWAQTVDGRIATRPPLAQSTWISCEASRRMVHRQRGRIDAILTGIGTVLADDPLLTARNVRLRREAQRPAHGGQPLRVVIDSQLKIPLYSRLVSTAMEFPTLIACLRSAMASHQDKVTALQQAGALVLGIDSSECQVPLREVLRVLVSQHDVTHVQVEAGSGVMSALFRQRLVNEAWVFTAPMILGDEHAYAAVGGMHAAQLTDGTRLRLWALRRREGDIIARYLVQPPSDDVKP